MKIAWLAPYPASDLGDAVRWAIQRISTHPCSWIINLSRALSRMPDVELHLLTICPWVTHSQKVEKDGVIVHLIKSGMPLIHRGWPEKLPFNAISGFWFESRKLCAALDRIQPDVVHAHGTEMGYSLGAMRSGYPYLISIQGIIAEINKTNPCAYYERIIPKEALVVEKSHYFTCRTHFDSGFVRRLNPTAKIFAIPEAMNPAFWEARWTNPKGNRVLFIGGGEPLKGLHELINAMGIVVKGVPQASIDAIGHCSSERRNVLESKAKDAGVPIRFHGFMNASEIAAFHRQCDLYVLCSSNENSPNALAEAAVSGMPCVAYDVGGVSSMIDDGKTGLLVKARDVADLAAVITDLLHDREKAERLGAAAAELARTRHRPEQVAKKTLAAYREIMDSKNQPRM